MDSSEYPNHCCYGDGEEIEDSVLDHIRAVTWNHAMSLKFAPGDVIMLENMLCQHSRIGYHGDRRILVFLGEPVFR